MALSKSSSGFRYYLLILNRRWLPASCVFVVVTALAMLAVSLKKPVYVAEGKLKFIRTNPTSTLTGVGKGIGDLEPLVEQSNPRMTEAEVIRSVPVVTQTIQTLNLKNQAGKPIKYSEFSKDLQVSDVRGADVLKVSYKGKDPDRAAAVVNTLMATYLKHNMLSNRAEVMAARQFIEQQLPTVEARVSDAEDALRQFKQAHRVVSLKEEATSAVSAMAELQQQLTSIQSQLANANAQSRSVESKLGVDPQDAISLTALSQSTGVQDSLKEIQQVETDLASARGKFTSKAPQVLALEDRLTQLRSVLQQRADRVVKNPSALLNQDVQQGALRQDLTKEMIALDNQRQGLAEQLATLSQAQAAYRQRADALPGLEKQQRELERKLEAAQSTYSSLLQKVSEIRVAENQTVGNAQIISLAPVPEDPLSTQPYYLAAGLLGLLAAGATVWGLEQQDQSIKTIDQAKQVFGFTLLGMIPGNDKARKVSTCDGEIEQPMPEMMVKDAPISAIGAAYRMLQTNLTFLSSDKRPKLIVLTSSVAKEGKSTVSANLAAALAQSGRQVLLIDANLYNPSQHQIWQTANEVGLSNVLVKQADIKIAIQSVLPNLDLLTSGVIPPNSLALLDSQGMASLMDRFAINYDFVIVDTPPLALATDALILGRMADGVLLVARLGLVDLASATFTKNLLQQSGQNVLGQVLNGVVEKKLHSHYYFNNTVYSPSNNRHVTNQRRVE